MNLRDRAVVLVLAALIVGLAGVMASGAFDPTSPVAAPGTDSPERRVLRVGIVGRPTSINPLTARTQADRDLVALVYRGLVALGPDGSYVPDLAESWTSDATGATWTFTLRREATWQDGNPVTAADVVYTIRTLQDAGFAGPSAASWHEVTVTPVDARTVRFQLRTPLGGFLQAATQPLLPAHLLDGVQAIDLADHPFNQAPVGNGPFRLERIDESSALLAAALPTSFDPVGPGGAAATPPTARQPIANLGQIEFRFHVDEAALAAAYERGEVDAADGLLAADAARLAAANGPGGTILRYPGTTLTMVALNLRPSRRDFQDGRVRTALLAATDRDGLVTGVLDGAGHRADGPIPPSSWAFDAAATGTVAHEPAAAAKALAAAGWTKKADGWYAPRATRPYVLELIAPGLSSNPVASRAATAVADDWRTFGLTVNVVALDAGTFVEDRLRAGRFQAAVVDVAVGHDPDLYPLLASTQVTADGSNVIGLQSRDLDARLTAARAPGAVAARKKAYADLQALLSKQRYLVPLFFRDYLVLLRRDLDGRSVRELSDPSDRFWDVLTWRLASDR